MPQERKNLFYAFIKVLWVKDTCEWGINSQTSCSSHTGNSAPGCGSGEGCGAMEVSLDTVRNSSCWGWGSCSHGAQWSSVRYSCHTTDLGFSKFIPFCKDNSQEKSDVCPFVPRLSLWGGLSENDPTDWGGGNSSLDSAGVVRSHSQPFTDPWYHHLGTGQGKAWTPELFPLLQASQAAFPSSPAHESFSLVLPLLLGSSMGPALPICIPSCSSQFREQHPGEPPTGWANGIGHAHQMGFSN